VARMERTPGRHVTRRLDEPRLLSLPSQRTPTLLAGLLAEAHNQAVRDYGSDCGGFHAFDPIARESGGVWESGGGFPDGTVVSRLAWGRIDAFLAQRLLDADAVSTTETTKD
jgi:hypothetical protein